MLLYQPPFLMVDALTVFPDHADPEAFYYVVSVPELVLEADGPAFWATAILPAVAISAEPAGAEPEIGRAMISFDVQLAAPPLALENVQKEIRRRWGREAKRLEPAPLSRGKASLAVARPGAGEASKDIFVYEGHSPSLIGDNRAAFAVAAQGQEAQVLVASLAVGHVPAVVTYELEFLGLAPSFEARMTVHWSSVYQRFRERELSNFIFASDEVDRTIEELEEKRAIEIDVKELDPEGAKAATKSLFDELKSQVIKKLFENPLQAGDVPVEERIGRGVRDVLTSVLPGVSHSLRQLDQTFLADAVIDLHEQQVHSYPAYPQSTLAGLVQRAGGVEGRLKFVRLDDLPHRVEEVLVEMAGGAARLGVRSVLLQVQVHSPGEEEPLLDESVLLEGPEPGRQVLRFRRRGTDEPSLRYRAEMTMDPALAPEGRERWTFDWQAVEGQRIWFNPEEWLDVADLRLEVDDPAVFDVPARVEMEVEAWLPGDVEPFRRAHFDFGKDAMSRELSVVVPEGRAPVFRGRETFRRQGEPDFVREIPSIEGAVHRIMNPFGQAWSMEIRAVASWDNTEALFAALRVWDPARRVWLRDEHRFSQQEPVYTLRFATSPETPRKAEAQVSRVGRDGSIVRGPWKDLVGPVVAVTDAVEPVRRVRVTLMAPQFAELRVRKAWAELEYHDPAQGIDETAKLELPGAGAVADWVHPFRDPSHPGYRFRLRATGESGERYNAPWTDGAADDLELVLPPSAW